MSGSFSLYRATNPDGSTRDMAIAADPNGGPVVVMYEGKTGGGMSVSRQPISDATPEKITAAIEKEVGELVRAGYVYVGEATIRGNRVASVATQTAESSDDLHWEVVVPIPPQKLAETLDEMARAMGSWPVDMTQGFSRDEFGIRVTNGRNEWSFGYRASPHGMIDPKTGRGGGSLRAFFGPLPLLVFAVIERRHPGHVVVADTDGNPIEFGYREVSERIAESIPVEVLRNLAERLGLRAPSFSSLSVNSRGFWV
jgi:hypothetical protein